MLVSEPLNYGSTVPTVEDLSSSKWWGWYSPIGNFFRLNFKGERGIEKRMIIMFSIREKSFFNVAALTLAESIFVRWIVQINV